MVVYVDVAFAVNCAVDFCLLLLTAALLRRRVRLRRVASAAGLGALYAVAALFPHMEALDWFAGKWLCSVVLVQIAFGSSPRRRCLYRQSLLLLRDVGVFYAVTFGAAGAVYALAGFLSGGGALSGLTLVRGQVVWWTSFKALALVLGLPGGLLLLRSLSARAARIARTAGHACRLEVELGGDTVCLSGLHDTGNELRDPISGMPVAVVRAAALSKLLPESLHAILKHDRNPLAALYDAPDVPSSFAERIRIVPFRAVGGRGGHLLAIRPDAVRAIVPGGVLDIGPMLLALQTDDLSGERLYDCILPASADPAEFAERSESVAQSGATASTGEAVHTSHTA
jgi:stage II sporulation protein GA (sporulation sigma-E factor processing peptidase)